MPQVGVQPNDRLPLHIVLKGEGFLVIDKPAGVVAQPGKGHATDTVLNAVAAKHGEALRNLGAARDWGLLHRLDREASGLMLIGLRPRAYDELRRQFEAREIEKRYWAAVVGKPAKSSGVIRAPIRESTRGRGGMKVAEVARAGAPGAQRAVTAYRLLDTTGKASVLECRLGTGRLHQIRAHLAWLGNPVVGDGLYGEGRAKGAGRLALHACCLGFTNPETGERVEVWSAWPKDLAGALRRLGLRRPHPSAGADVSEGDESPRPRGRHD